MADSRIKRRVESESCGAIGILKEFGDREFVDREVVDCQLVLSKKDRASSENAACSRSIWR